MDWHQINYFQKVAKVQHITRAAEQLSISQPALSRSISKLEDELGVQLFDRKGRNIYLNRYGKMFLNRVEQSIKQIDIGKQEIWDEIHPDHGTISLSFLPSLGINVVPDILSSFQKMHPNIKFQLTQASNRQIIEQLKTRKVDLALTSLLHEDKEVNCQVLLTEELFLAVSFDHPLASWNALDLNMVKDEPFISFKDDNVLQTIINDLCKRAGFSPDVVFEGDDIGTVSGLVGAKLGVSLIPELHVLDRSKVKLIRVKNPVCKREIGMAWLKDAYLSPVAERFIQYINRFFKNH
ncbi:LysR family transcriptional regulator [Peribacillus frigoritolerans]|uniref:LysR family transcriptional regulator n=1 Tax=Peribacillus frigoritolerans TaxID=450367 RepID=UPI0023DC5657|nr:LysR family transcriptional regulator [Peribacillus frigoritolerans]MDF1999490.1 LysR family transcriptional regulator [Peribacillus frigoritolerans]